MNRNLESSEAVPLSEIQRSPGTMPHGVGLQAHVIECGWLICLFAIVAVFCVRPSHSADEDLWWHLRTGAWILQHGAAPTQDLFARSTIGKPWIAYTWLFDVLIAKTYELGGLRGVLTLTTVLTLSFVGSVVLLLSRYGRMLPAIGLSVLVYIATAPLITPRPWLFTCVFFVIELSFLLRARERNHPVWLLPIVPLLALWANVHIQFVYGLGIIGLFALERSLATLLRWRVAALQLSSRYFWVLLAVSTLATLLNPYGWRLYTVVAQYATQTTALQYVQEMQAMQFRSVTDWTALLLSCSALFAVASSKQRSALMLCLLAVSVWFGFHTGRDVWFLVVVSALVLVSSMKRAEPVPGMIRGIQWMISMPIALALAFAVLHSEPVSPKALRRDLEKRFPERAIVYIQGHRMQPPLYNSYGWGGYLMWRLPGLPVSIDGRANVHGDERLARFTDTWLGRANWSSDRQLMEANTILLERDSALASILRSNPRFRIVYDDDTASVFEPLRIPEPIDKAKRSE